MSGKIITITRNYKQLCITPNKTVGLDTIQHKTNVIRGEINPTNSLPSFTHQGPLTETQQQLPPMGDQPHQNRNHHRCPTEVESFYFCILTLHTKLVSCFCQLFLSVVCQFLNPFASHNRSKMYFFVCNITKKFAVKKSFEPLSFSLFFYFLYQENSSERLYWILYREKTNCS